MADRTCIMCWPVAKPGRVIRGSIKQQCSICVADVWLAPSGRRIIEEKKAEIVCLDCYKRLPDVKLMQPTPEQLGEIVADHLAGGTCA